MASKPTARDFEILEDLIAASENYLRYDWGEWVRPLDCGGSNSSDHSYRLSKLARMGLAESKQRNAAFRMNRGSKVYRPTKRGRLALAAYFSLTGRQIRFKIAAERVEEE